LHGRIVVFIVVVHEVVLAWRGRCCAAIVFGRHGVSSLFNASRSSGTGVVVVVVHGVLWALAEKAETE
jgi:hypothetical protein